MEQLIHDICVQNQLEFISCQSVSGGDINKAFTVYTSSGPVFVKLNSANLYPGMFKKEAESLIALQQPEGLRIPAVLATGHSAGWQYLMLEYLQKAPPTHRFWEDFATKLVLQHKCSSPQFGWPASNYIGSLVQHNMYYADWASFYTQQRIMPLCKKLMDDHHFSSSEMGLAEKLCFRLREVFPDEPAALLHGDLWAGNFMVAKDVKSQTIQPCVYDPAVYYGHREMDLGMSLLFGGFDKSFYQYYNDFYPMEQNWQSRLSLAQLYPLLVHAILFGGSYIKKCRDIIKLWS